MTPRAPSRIALAGACGHAITLLNGEEARPLCAACDEEVRKAVRRKIALREYRRRWRIKERLAKRRARQGDHFGGEMIPLVQVTRHGPGSDPYAHLRDRAEPDLASIQLPTDLLPSKRTRVRFGRPEAPKCSRCEIRPLNLGRFKTQGTICRTCREEGDTRVISPLYATFEEVARQLEDETPLEDDDDGGEEKAGRESRKKTGKGRAEKAEGGRR